MKKELLLVAVCATTSLFFGCAGEAKKETMEDPKIEFADEALEVIEVDTAKIKIEEQEIQESQSEEIESQDVEENNEPKTMD